MELDSNVYSVIITAITLLGGTSAWRYYEKRSLYKERDDSFIREDCKDRIARLEALLTESSAEKDEMRGMILKLTSQVASLKVQVEFLTKEP
jgi:hypothetical protein|tara:strand:+ start:206 stop:481 length:276 start_codon:yes stop_codon:yes gene_type:complete